MKSSLFSALFTCSALGAVSSLAATEPGGSAPLVLTKPAFDRAAAFMHTAAPLDRAIFAWEFEHGPSEDVVEALAARQNADGGFYGLDPDLDSPASNVISTTTGLHLCAELGLGTQHPMVQRALAYLRAGFDPKFDGWAIIPAHDNTRPHAPWWHYSPEFADQWARFQDNPRPDVLACLYLFPDRRDDDLRARVAKAVLARIDTLAEAPDVGGMECYAFLAEAPGIPSELRRALERRMPGWIAQRVERDPANWVNYNLRPLDIADHPDSPWRGAMEAAVQANLDYLVTRQCEDGSYLPHWSWHPLFPEVWPEVKRKWQAILTRKALHHLRIYGRLEGWPAVAGK